MRQILAPKAVLSTSGTKDRRRSVVYKLHPSPQTTLEGERVFSIIFKVPAQWSADWVLVTCEASCVNRGDKAQAGLRSFAVGLYLEDNQEARQAAERLSVEQQRLSDALEQACKDAETQSNWVSWLKTAWKWYGYLQRFSRPIGASAQPIPIVPENVAYFEEYLPENVKNRFTAVNEAKRQLEALSGSQK